MDGSLSSTPRSPVGQDPPQRREGSRLQRRAEQLEAVLRLGREILTVYPLEVLLPLTVRLIHETFGYFHVAILTVDSRQQRLLFRCAAGGYADRFPSDYRPPLGYGLIGLAAQTGQTILSNDVQHDSRYAACPAVDTGSELDIPLKVGERLLGVLDLQDPRPNAFDPDDIPVLEFLADQVALAIENARLYEAEQRRTRQLSAVMLIAQAVNSSLDPTTVLQRALERTLEMVGRPLGCIYLYDREHHRLILQAHHGLPPEYVEAVRSLPWPFPTLQSLLQAGAEPMLSRALHRHVPEWGEAQRRYRIHTLSTVLHVREQVVGLLSIADGPVDEELVSLMEAVANQIAVAVQNALLHHQVQRSEARYRQLVERANDAIAVFDPEGRWVICNERAAAMVGRSREEMYRLPVTALLPPESLWPALRFAARLRRRGRAEGLEIEVLHADGHRIAVEVSGAVLDDGTYEVIARDISEQRALERLREELVHMVVHDLRSPVGTLRNSLILLQDALEGRLPQGDPNQLLEIAHRATGRMASMISTLLDIHRLESGATFLAKQPTDVRAFIQDALEQMGFLAHRKGVRVHAPLPPYPLTLWADPDLLTRVVVNLLDNAIKFTPRHGEVTVMVEEQPDGVVVRVRDSGPGIPAVYHRRIFDKFARLRTSDQEAIPGSGLGLAFCKLAVEAHGGRIWVESQPGQGATFSFFLPGKRLEDG